MPIRRYVEKGVVFTPQALSAVSKAIEATREILGVEGDEAKRQAVARFIVRLAREDASLDAAELRDRPWRRWEASHTSRLPRPPALGCLPKRRMTLPRSRSSPALGQAQWGRRGQLSPRLHKQRSPVAIP